MPVQTKISESGERHIFPENKMIPVLTYTNTILLTQNATICKCEKETDVIPARK